MYRYDRVKTASTLNFHDQFMDLCHRWNGQVAYLLAQKLGGVASYSDTAFHVKSSTSYNHYITGRLVPATPLSRKSTVEFEIAVAKATRKWKAVAADADSVVQKIIWELEDAGMMEEW
jgi:hypothetical protein